MTSIHKFMKPFIGSAVLAVFVLILPQMAEAQRPSLGGISDKIDDVQETLGPKPAQPEDPNIQQQLDDLKQLICALPVTPPGVGCNKIVFVTSSTQRANFGGLAGGDAICNNLAGQIGLPGTYLAWLSDSTSSPSTRFTRSTLPYVLPNGDTVADNYTDLTSGTLARPIDRVEFGLLFSDFPGVWTGTNPDGTPTNGFGDCLGWTSQSATVFGAFGMAEDTDPGWTAEGADACSSFKHLYCFQQ